MNMPGFTAEASLFKTSSDYFCSGRPEDSLGNGVVPAIPFCGNCDDILERCEENGWLPRAVCNACNSGNCFSGVENPPPRNPWETHPWW